MISCANPAVEVIDAAPPNIMRTNPPARSILVMDLAMRIWKAAIHAISSPIVTSRIASRPKTACIHARVGWRTVKKGRVG